MRVASIGCGTVDTTLLPTGSHDAVLLATVERAQPYLSANRTAVYTEYRLDVEEAFKAQPGGLPVVEGEVTIDRPGGVLRLRSGRIISYGSSGTSMARPLDVGRRYVLFGRAIFDGRDLILGRAFELRDGLVYVLGEQPGQEQLIASPPRAVMSLVNEGAFLDAVRAAVAHPWSARYFSAPDDRAQRRR